tara:strand:- start:1 stop:126 length:126 start_codon:yes stop_codon:yes gene_type:complete
MIKGGVQGVKEALTLKKEAHYNGRLEGSLKGEGKQCGSYQQ